MAQYIWFETSASSSLTPPTASFRSRPPAQQIRLWLNTASSTPLAQYVRLNTSGSILLAQQLLAIIKGLILFGTTNSFIRQNLWLNTYGSKNLPRHLLLLPPPLGQHLWLNTSGSILLAQYFWLNTSGSILLAQYFWLNNSCPLSKV